MNQRIQDFQKNIEADAAIVEDPSDLLYLTGLALSRGMFVATKEEAVLFVDGRYFAIAERKAPCPVRLEDKNSLSEWLQARNVKTLEFDSAHTSYERYEALKGNAERLVPKSALLKWQRAVKGAEEIAALKRAADLTWKGYEHAKSMLKEGISEEELAFEFELFVRKHGASGLSFDSIMGFGENTAYPHHKSGKARLSKGQVVLIDVGAIVDKYQGDLTRVVFFGKPDPTIEKWLEWTQEAQKSAMDILRAGIHVKDLDLAARKVFARYGVEELFTHGLGHGIGLETHEFPSLKAAGVDRDATIKAGMVITIEPGLYKPGVGGVRWEDMFLVHEKGYERLYP